MAIKLNLVRNKWSVNSNLSLGFPKVKNKAETEAYVDRGLR